MVGAPHENRVHVDRVKSERLDVIELALYACQIAVIELSEVVVAGGTAVAWIAHLRVPRVVMDHRGGIGAIESWTACRGSGAAVVVGPIAIAEAVGQNVIHIGVLQPCRSLEVWIVYRDLKRIERLATCRLASPVLVDVVVIVEVIVAVPTVGCVPRYGTCNS